MRDRWTDLCRRLGDGDHDGALWLCLEALYAMPPRAYHSLTHVAACLDQLDRFRHPHDPDAVEFALFLHDAVYQPGRPDNEIRSARIAATMLAGMNAPVARRETVRGLIQATDHRTAASSSDERLIIDVDLSILGADATEYDAYAAAIRAEFGFVNDADFAAGRSRFLRSMLERHSIYSTASIRNAFEHSARANMARELIRLAS